MIQAVLFDMDGLMINTEPLQSMAYETVLKEYGKSPQFYSTGVVQKVGVKEKDNWVLIKNVYHLEEEITTLMEKRSKIYLEVLKKNLIPQPGLIQLLKLLKQHHIKMAVASSSVLEHIEMVLEGLRIRDYFDVLMSGQFAERGKPFPDIFLDAAKKLQVEPENCLVLEDAQSGVEAGKAAGAKVIAVPNEFTADQDMSKADKIVYSLENISWETISRM